MIQIRMKGIGTVVINTPTASELFAFALLLAAVVALLILIGA